MAMLHNLSTSDSLGEWRKTKSFTLGKKIQKRFHDLQNPSNCLETKKIVCDMNKACGYGCQMHHAMYCFITAYFTNRTMILESNSWRYNVQGLTAYFKPISNTCTSYEGDAANWNGKS